MATEDGESITFSEAETLILWVLTRQKSLNWIHNLGIKITTLFVLSTENLDRNDEEVDNIYRLLVDKLEKLSNDPRVHQASNENKSDWKC